MSDPDQRGLDPALLAAYRGSSVTVALGDRWVPATEFAAARGIELFVVTAWNPRSEPLGDAENRARDAELGRALSDAGLAHRRSRSCGNEVGWFEEGYAITAISTAEALELGRRFGQLAVFWVRPGHIEVLACSTGSPGSRPPE